GQNPLQLAIQQGTQISQVIGPMGAAGAVRALGGAFFGALNPVNLAVMGVLGGLGLLMQHLRSGRDEVLSLSDAMSQLETSTGDWQRALQ
ncbi:phage tail length tape measure family protein, partial [Streptomyces sp. P9(2023)]|uniref:phage tail length tape measure family protein n=1 Tax=Streptomyces sp. P9(2023) TaxID=3064394 RepID=UPI0028F43425